MEKKGLVLKCMRPAFHQQERGVSGESHTAGEWRIRRHAVAVWWVVFW